MTTKLSKTPRIPIPDEIRQRSEVLDFLDRHDACGEGRRFARQYATMAEVWDHCPRPDWMEWICMRHGVQIDDATLRRFACMCIRLTPTASGRTVWDLLTDGRSRAAVEVSERHAMGLATDADLAAAGDAARDAARAAARAAAWDAARDAARDAAWAAAWDAARAAASAAASAAARDAAWDAAREVQASLFRYLVPNPFRADA